MYANFTEETCTGTGATLALAGATTGNIVFSESFADGDLVAYVLEDSGGTIKVAGVGTYVSATDDITRDDTWSYDTADTPKVNDNPATNKTLSGGTHTVRCDVVGAHISPIVLTATSIEATSHRVPDNIQSQDANNVPVADRAYFVYGTITSPRVMTAFELNIITLYASSSNTRQALYAANLDGSIGELLEDSGNIDISTTGLKTTTLGTPRKLKVGGYWFGVVTDNTTARWWGIQNTSSHQAFAQPQGINIFRSQRPSFPYATSITGAFPSTITIAGYDINFPITAGYS